MSDLADYMKKSVTENFPQSAHLACFFHLKTNVHKKLKEFKINMEKIKKIENEVSIISRSTNKKIFDKLYELFFENYKEEKTFIKYFNSTYYNKNSNWYVSSSEIYIGRTNNILESFNSTIKRSISNYRLLPIWSFIERFKQIKENNGEWYDFSDKSNDTKKH